LKAHIQNILRVAALSLTVALGGFGSAHAAIIKGSFDPAFGAPFNTVGSVLGWEGTVEFYVPNACLLNAGPIDQNNGCNNNSDPALNMHIISASVDLYNFDDSNQTSLELLDFLPSALFPFTLDQISVSAGKVTGIATGYSVPVNPDESTFAGINLYSFALGFDLVDGPTLLAMNSLGQYVSITQALYDVSLAVDARRGNNRASNFVLATNDWIYDRQIARAERANRYSQLDPANLVNPQFYSFTDLSEVPEPATIVLMLGAMVALSATTRRRSKSAS